jgi:hypothetical protein
VIDERWQRRVAQLLERNADPRASVAFPSCLGAGSSSVPSPGSCAGADWYATNFRRLDILVAAPVVRWCTSDPAGSSPEARVSCATSRFACSSRNRVHQQLWAAS